MKISRRDLLKFAAGSAAGIMFTPVPWKVLDDSAIWTQNWPWIPVPAKGEATTRFTTCTLCPAGCGLKLRCIAGQPVSVAGVADHPVSRGVLCPIAFGAHHLPYHPARVTAPLRRTVRFGSSESIPVALDDAIETIVAAIKSASAGEAVALLDQRPERGVSESSRRLLAHIPNALYLRGPEVEEATLSMCATILGLDPADIGFDFENANTILNFGAPLFDGWGTPGRMFHLAERRRQTGRPTIFHVETRQSRSALQADAWIPIKPASEGVLALGLAHQLVRESSGATRAPSSMDPEFIQVLDHFPPEKVSAMTGVPVEVINNLARAMVTGTPTLVLGAGDPAGGPLRPEDSFGIAALNFVLGSVGRKGGIIVRARGAAREDDASRGLTQTQIQNAPDRSIRVLLLDGPESGHAIPWALIERKLADEKALVVSFSPYLAGLARHAQIILPSPSFLESWQDVPTPFHASARSFSLSPPFLSPPQGAIDAHEVLRRLAAAFGAPLNEEESSSVDLLKARVAMLYTSGSGSVFTPADRRTTSIKDLGSSEKVWTALAEGGCWVEEPASERVTGRVAMFLRAGISPQRLIGLGEEQISAGMSPAGSLPLVLMPYGWRGAAGSGQISPVMSKLYQESGLRSLSSQVLVNPETAKANGMRENAPTTLHTRAGSFQVLVTYDASVMPGVLHLAIGPDEGVINSRHPAAGPELLSMCLAEDGRCWRLVRAQVSKTTV